VSIDATQATAAGEDYQNVSFEPWAPTMCLMNLAANTHNKRLILKANGLNPLMSLLRTKDSRTHEYASR